MNAPFKAAVVQMASIPDDALATAESAAARLREAAANGARLAVFPEALTMMSRSAPNQPLSTRKSCRQKEVA